MLTELRLKNFIHFKERQVFRFKQGLNILLGTNHTGKTSVFEAVRRCMSVWKNSGLSNPHDPKDIAYAICKFENDGCTVYSSIIVVRVFDKDINLKAVVVKRSGEISNKAVDIILQRDHNLKNEELRTEEFDFKSLDEDGELSKEGITKYLEAIGQERVESFFSNPPQEKKETPCESILKEFVDEKAVIIFPFRSFSPYQWTLSKRDMTGNEGDIIDELTLKKEIVYWYLNPNTEKISEDIRQLEDRYFNQITGNSGFKFKLVEGRRGPRVSVSNVLFTGNNPNTENLLKIPEGIYEAKSAAIILAVKQFKTICLDDAERGMHPQMIERLRDMVLQDIDDKVVLVITHHPAFLAPWNISRTHFFQRHEDQDGYKFAVKPLAEQFGGKDPQIITSGQFSSLFFAERICWVEGKTEYMFMTALKYEFVRKRSSALKEYCTSEDWGEDKQERFRDFLSTLHIVSMDGEAGKCFFRNVSLKLDLAHFFILDFDALSNNLPGSDGKPNEPEKKLSGSEESYQCTVEKFCKAFRVKICDVSNIKTMDDVLDTLQDHGIFVWRLSDENNISTGCIEHAVDRMRKKDSDLLKFLNEKNVKLERKKNKKLQKLFKDNNITNADITAVVKELLNRSKTDVSSDLNRLVKFLKNVFQRRQTMGAFADRYCEPAMKRIKTSDTE